MAKATQTKDPNALAEVAGNVFAGIIGVFSFIILAVFPLYYRNYYFDILKAKYKFYWIAVAAMLGVCLLVALVFCFVDQMEYGGENRKRFFARLKPANWKEQPLTYRIMVVFWLFAALATILSDYKYESFWGNEGRFSGLFLITLYVLSVFVVGKLGKIKKWYLDLFLAAGVLVCLFGITDYFRMDVLGWKANIKSTQLDSFTSTMGNINTYTAFVALVMGGACGLFVAEKNIFRNIWYYVVILISFFAIITGQSDNAYLALGALFGLLPFVLFASRKGVVRYSVLVATFMTVIKVIDEINKRMPEKVIGLSGIFSMLTQHEMLEVIVIALWAGVAVLYISDWKMTSSGKEDSIGKWLRIVWLCVIIAAAAVVLYVLYDANFGGHAEKYEAISRYVVFDDSWGTNRGYCWRIGWESYLKQPMVHKLFGFGPDTFGILTWDYREEALALHGVYYESAHNEYLQYLVTMGPFAVVSYILFLGSACAAMLRGYKDCPWILAPLAAVVCYGVQALVNINLPIATPVMWWLLAVGLALCRKKKITLESAEKKEQPERKEGSN